MIPPMTGTLHSAMEKWITDMSLEQSLTADIFNETGLAGSREAFAQAFTAMAQEG